MIRPKKSLGQNFLIDNNILDKIVKLATIRNNNIVEIGPGTGNLTRKIIEQNPKNLLMIEKDHTEQSQDLLIFFLSSPLCGGRRSLFSLSLGIHQKVSYRQ